MSRPQMDGKLLAPDTKNGLVTIDLLTYVRHHNSSMYCRGWAFGVQLCSSA